MLAIITKMTLTQVQYKYCSVQLNNLLTNSSSVGVDVVRKRAKKIEKREQNDLGTQEQNGRRRRRLGVRQRRQRQGRR